VVPERVTDGAEGAQNWSVEVRVVEAAAQLAAAASDTVCLACCRGVKPALDEANARGTLGIPASGPGATSAQARVVA